MRKGSVGLVLIRKRKENKLFSFFSCVASCYLCVESFLSEYVVVVVIRRQRVASRRKDIAPKIEDQSTEKNKAAIEINKIKPSKKKKD